MRERKQLKDRHLTCTRSRIDEAWADQPPYAQSTRRPLRDKQGLSVSFIRKKCGDANLRTGRRQNALSL